MAQVEMPVRPGDAETLGTHELEGLDAGPHGSDGLDPAGLLHLLRHLPVELEVAFVIGARGAGVDQDVGFDV